MKILIVDDTETWIILVKIWLHKLGIEYDYAKNGFEAIAFLQNYTYDFMITDISMPEMSGFKLVDYVKKHYNILIAVMSNHDEYINLMGNVEYRFIKPNTFDKFKLIINIIATGKCKLINYGECNVTKYGSCDLKNTSQCILKESVNEPVK